MNGRDEWRDGELDVAAASLARMALERRGLETVGKELVADAAHVVVRQCAYANNGYVRNAVDAIVAEAVGQGHRRWL